jgi:hypothetical protein
MVDHLPFYSANSVGGSSDAMRTAGPGPILYSQHKRISVPSVVVCRIDFPPNRRHRFPDASSSRDQLHNAAGFGNLLLGQLANPSCADNQGNLGDPALAQNLGVAEGQKIEDGNGILLLASDVGIAGLGGDE